MSDMQVVRSRDNPHAKRLDALLRQKKAREASGLFVLEGSRLCVDAIGAGLWPESLLITPSAAQKNDVLTALTETVPETVWLDETLAERLGETKTPQGVFAVFENPAPPVIEVDKDGRYLLLYQVRDPGNLGGILRTAAALGATAAFLCECAELYSPKVLRASMGGAFRVPVSQVDDMAPLIKTLREFSIGVYAAALEEGCTSPVCLNNEGGKAVLIGNEAFGLNGQLIDACTGSVAIPMKGGSQSLNAAMAAGILLWEMLRDNN